MDEKEKDLDLNENEDLKVSKDSNDDVTYETNDDWKFDAEDPTADSKFDMGEYEVKFPEEQKTVQDLRTNSAQSKKSSSSVSVSKNAIKFTICGIITIAVVAMLIVFGIRYYTVPNQQEKMNPGNVAMTVGDEKVSIGMYDYYYSCVTQNYIQYANYGYYDLDTTKDYSEQTTTDSDGNKITWEKKFEEDTNKQIQFLLAYYQEAVKNDYKLTKDQQKTIDTQIQSLQDKADEEKVTVDQYVASMYGNNCGVATLKKMLEQCYVAENYYQETKVKQSVSDKEVDAYFKKNKNNYSNVKFAYLQMSYDTTSSATEEKSIAKAKTYVSKIKDLKSLKSMLPTVCEDLIKQYESYYSCTEAQAIKQLESSVETSITKSDTTWDSDITDWLFDSETKVNDVTYVPVKDDGYIYIVIKLAEPELSKSKNYSIRQILITPESDSDSSSSDTSSTKEYTAAQWAAAKAKAEKVLKEYTSGDKTEMSFAKLAEEYSADTESTSQGSSSTYGGLYENMTKDTLDTYVESFRKWVIADHKAGDTGIIKSTYGYHIMYYISSNEEWKSLVISDIKSEKEKELTSACKIKKHAGFDKIQKAEPTSSSNASSSASGSSAASSVTPSTNTESSSATTSSNKE